MRRRRGLQDYEKKRNFQRTDEPAGISSVPSHTVSDVFMIHKHGARRLHYDLRLGFGGVLKSWAVPKGPSMNPDDKRLAVRTEDHPYDYKSYEGVIPDKQYGAGPSLIWDAGRWRPLTDVDEGLRRGHLRFYLSGVKLKGVWNLVRIRGGEKEQWLLIKERDKYVGADDNPVESLPESVVSGRTLEELRLDAMPIRPLNESYRPQLAVLSSQVPDRKNWVFEKKFDGYRFLVYKNRGRVKFITRNRKDWTARLAEMSASLAKSPLASAVFDGELVFEDRHGKNSFQKLQNSLTEDKDKNHLRFYVFDLLYLEGVDLAELPFVQRRKVLESLWPVANISPPICLSELLDIEKNEDVREKACLRGWEGAIAKRKTAVYTQGRSADWLKFKCQRRRELVVIGMTPPRGSREHFGSLLLAEYQSGQLHYRGRVGTGFNRTSLRQIHRKLSPLKARKPKNLKGPAIPGSRQVQWVSPAYLAEVAYAEQTAAGILRHPVFKGLREDKSAQDLREEGLRQNGERSSLSAVKITHPKKILYRKMGITKTDLIDYYGAVADRLLAFAAHRPLSLLRCPQGAEADCFFQRHLHHAKGRPPQVKIVLRGRTENYSYLRDLGDIQALVQLGVLELHCWNSRVENIDQPQFAVFDLDPAADVSFSEVTRTAWLIKLLLEEMGRESFVRTTGGKGLHVLTPLKEMNWEECKIFSKSIAENIAKAAPEKFTAQMAKKKRPGKIFIDYLRNQKAASSVVNYSPRAKPGAPVATPLFWEEVHEDLDPQDFDLLRVERRLRELKHDPWRDFYRYLQIGGKDEGNVIVRAS